MELGVLAALSSAGLWAITSFIYSHLKLPAWVLNLSKSGIGCVFIFFHLVFLRLIAENDPVQATMADWGWLGVSGIVGILIGDTCYFRSLQILGPGRALMLTTSSPIFSVLIGYYFLAEWISLTCGVGLLITLLGITVVIADQRNRSEEPGIFPGTLTTGILYAALGSLCQAMGGALAKFSLDTVDALYASFIRLLIPTALALLFILSRVQWRKQAAEIFARENVNWLIGGSILGTWLGIWFMLVSYQETKLAIAQTLLSTSPLFAIPLAYLLKKHVSSLQTIGGATVAILGIYLLLQ